MKTCPKCARQWPDDALFCGDDATPLPPSQPEEPEPLIVGKYRILERIGGGGMGTVYVGEHVTLGRRDAVKMLNRSMADDPEALARFHREARNASTIRHENVCVVYDFGETPEGLSYLAMELVEGVSLAELLEREGGYLDPETAGAILGQAAEGLQAAHDRSIVHRDLKPGNIMVSPRSEGGWSVKVVDFGIAKAMGGVQDQEITQIGLVAGTPEYMSPEHLRGEEPDPRSDIYALGVVLFRTLTGTFPFSREYPGPRPMPLEQARPEFVFPPGLQGVVEQAMAHDPARRFPSARAFAKALGNAATVSVPPTVAVEGPERPSGARGHTRPGRSSATEPSKASGRRLVFAALSMIVVGAAGVAWIVSRGGEPGRLALDRATLDLAAGESATLTALEVATSGDTSVLRSGISWTTGNAQVARVESGRVFAGQVAGDTTSVWASVGADSVRVPVTVVPGPPTDMTLSAATDLGIGDVRRFTAQAFDRYRNRIEDARVVWEVDDPSVLDLEADGTGRGISAGRTQVRLSVVSPDGAARLDRTFDVTVSGGSSASGGEPRPSGGDEPPAGDRSGDDAAVTELLRRLCDEAPLADASWASRARREAAELWERASLDPMLRNAAAEVVSWAAAIEGDPESARLWEDRAGSGACVALRGRP